jgi:hypothetical protein
MKLLKQSTLMAALLLTASPPMPAIAQAPGAGSAVEAASQAILANPKVIKALEDIKADDGQAFAEQKRITEIPAPPYKERQRAEYFLKRLVELGFKDASRQAEARGLGASRHRVPRRDRRDGEGKGRRHSCAWYRR